MKYDAATGQMCFASALVSMKKGGKVRRPAWPAEDMLVIRFKYIARLMEAGQAIDRYSMVFSDVLAEDWQEAVVPL